jgi:hypothetical protein
MVSLGWMMLSFAIACYVAEKAIENSTRLSDDNRVAVVFYFYVLFCGIGFMLINWPGGL